jgi:acetyltransferase
MAEYPSDLERRHVLADGREATIRPIRPEDAPAERRFLERLSPESRRLHFQHAVAAPNAALLEFFTHVDHDHHMAFAAEAGGELVGNARYVVNPDGRSAEFGIVVAETWRHSGLAQKLMQALFDAAHARGLRSLEGLVLSENRNMLDFARELGFELSSDPVKPALVRAVKKL